MLTENLKILKVHFPEIWKRVIESKQEENEVMIETARNQEDTLAVKLENGWNYIHSKYDPSAEAERFVRTQSNIESASHILFYGVGLGYHIQEILKRNKDIKFSIYEPDIAVFKKFLSIVDLNQWKPNEHLINVITETHNDDVKINLKRFTHLLDEQVSVVIFGSYDRIYPDKTKLFVQKFREAIHENLEIMASKITFSKREAINGLKNLPHILKTPNILHGHNQMFKNKPAIIVAAGPSLNQEFENLRKIKEAGTAYIFSVGSAINSLISNGLYPDASFSYDGSIMNTKVFKKIIDNHITDIPLIFGSTIGYETVEKYPGKMANFFVRHDSAVEALLQRKSGEEILVTERLTTISSITISALSKIGCSPIILVGQNLGYLKDQYYASGIDYVQSVASQKQKDTALTAKDVYGNDMLSSSGHMVMRVEMEKFIKAIQPVTIINTTKGGAHIEGTTFMPLERVISELLSDRVVIPDWLERLAGHDFDLFYLRKQFFLLMESSSELSRIFNRFQDLLGEMSYFIDSQNIIQLDKAFDKFDKLFDRLQQNQFNLFFIQRMNSLGFEIIMKTFEAVRHEKNAILKAEKVVHQFNKYLESCKEDIGVVKDALKEMFDRINTESMQNEII